MGYTHYFPQKRSFTRKEWSKIQDAFLEITKSALENRGLVLRGWDGTGHPEHDGKYIRFNGNEDGDLSHETFSIQRSRLDEFNFCKTARKPYDLAVCAMLICINDIAPSALDIGSDGDESDWQEALNFTNSLDLVSHLKYPLGIRKPAL